MAGPRSPSRVGPPQAEVDEPATLASENQFLQRSLMRQVHLASESRKREVALERTLEGLQKEVALLKSLVDDEDATSRDVLRARQQAERVPELQSQLRVAEAKVASLEEIVMLQRQMAQQIAPSP